MTEYEKKWQKHIPEETREHDKRTAFAPAPAIPAGERFVRATRATTQAQLIVGVPGLPRDHPDQWVMGLAKRG